MTNRFLTPSVVNCSGSSVKVRIPLYLMGFCAIVFTENEKEKEKKKNKRSRFCDIKLEIKAIHVWTSGFYDI